MMQRRKFSATKEGKMEQSKDIPILSKTYLPSLNYLLSKNNDKRAKAPHQDVARYY